jgi:hypothetical protein
LIGSYTRISMDVTVANKSFEVIAVRVVRFCKLGVLVGMQELFAVV